MHKLGANIEKTVFLILSSGYGGGLDSINASLQAISEYVQWSVSGEWPWELKGLALPRYIVLFSFFFSLKGKENPKPSCL